MRAGAKSCERTPLLGDAFLISAMMAGGRAARAARKSRRAGRRSAASRSHASSGWAVRARSWRFLATIRARMSGIISIKGVDPMVSETLGGLAGGSPCPTRLADAARDEVKPGELDSNCHYDSSNSLQDPIGSVRGDRPGEYQLHSRPEHRSE